MSDQDTKLCDRCGHTEFEIRYEPGSTDVVFDVICTDCGHAQPL